MFHFIVSRILGGFAVLVFVILVVTGGIYLAPVDAERLSFGQRSDSQTVIELKKQYGLNETLYKQFWYYLGDLSPLQIVKNSKLETRSWGHLSLFSFENSSLILKWPHLRFSYQTGLPVSQVLKQCVPLTILLAVLSMTMAFIIGILFGAISAHFPNSALDRSIVALSVFGYSLPSYVSSIILALVLAFGLHRITGLDVQGSLFVLNELGDIEIRWKNLILPVLALGVRPIAVLTQLARTAFLEVLNEPYIRTAHAKGISSKMVFLRHVLKNSLNPIITASSGWLASMLTGAFFVETVFNYKGLGYTTVHALINFDIPVILACVLFTSMVFISVNILVDLSYFYIDPKMRKNV